MAPVIIELGLNSALPAWAMMLIVASLALVLIVAGAIGNLIDAQLTFMDGINERSKSWTASYMSLG